MVTLDDFVRKITYKRLATILMIMAVIPLIHPLGLPIPISAQTDAFKAEIDKLSPGSVIAFGFQIAGIGGIPQYSPGWQVITKYIASRQLRIVYVCVSDVSPIGVEDAIRSSGVETTYGWKKGVDYVITPYIAGEETALASFASDVQGTVATDYYGTPASQLPLMSNLTTLADFQLTIASYGTFTFADMFARQWAGKYPTVPMIVYGMFGTVAAYYPTLVRGALDLDRGSAEFEVLVRQPGIYASRMDARNTFGYTLIILMLLGNIAHYQTGGFKKKAGAGFERAFFGEQKEKEDEKK
jgi:hypothetical protein